MPEPLASKHRELGAEARRLGSTALFSKEDNYLYHQLELKNFLNSKKEIPGFIRAIPEQDLKDFLNHTVLDTPVGY